MIIKRIEEFKLTAAQHRKISWLLQQCFSVYPHQQSFYKQLPSFRYLVYQQKQLTAHLAIIHRLIKVNGKNFTIFGVSDFCVHPDFRRKKIASELLQTVETLGKKYAIDFIVLIAQEQNVYKKNGYQSCDNDCRWLIINELQALGVAKRTLENALMVKPLGQEKWEKGTVDFLGCLF
ncbi:MAG: GNAT family N-acetyltransferase [Bacteroidota bacterium]